jgi:hypothetical protein
VCRLCRRPPRGALGFLLGLDAIPGALDVRWAQPSLLVGEHMRMPSDHFARDCFDHVAERKRLLFLGHAGMKYHLQQEIAELVPQIVQITAGDGIGDFIGFLDRVGRDG